jgi:hypothetical protein
MGKLILTERQYNNIKNVLIEKVIEETFINEENMYADAAKRTIGDNKFFINKRTVTAPGTTGGFKLKFFKGVKFVEGNDPYLKTDGKTSIQFTDTFNNPGSLTKANILYNCKTGKLIVKDIENPDLSEMHGFEETKKTFYINDEILTREGFKLVCQNIKKAGKKDAEKINQGGGGEEGDKKTYTQEYDQTLKYKSIVNNQMVDLKIPKNTIYKSIPEKNGVSFSFKLDKTPINGWFGCKSKKFIINKSPVTDEKQDLTKKLFDKLCVKDSSKPEEVLYKGGGSSDTSVSSFDITQFDQYI